MSKSLFIREWLNENEGRGYIIVHGGEDFHNNSHWVDLSIDLADCSRNISLDFYYDTEETRQQKLKKLEKLISHMEKLREFISETPVQEKEPEE